MADKRIRLLVKAEVSKAIRDLDRLENQTDDNKQSADELTSTFKTLFGAAVLGAGARSVVQTASNFESLRTRLVALKGSTEEGAKAFNQFTKIAATTPFQVQNVVEAGATLEAFGVSSEDSLKSIADLAAFMGTDIVDASAAFGRAFAGGAGAADILRERGILQLIKDAEGIEDLSKLTLPEFRAALERAMTDPDGKIAGSTDLLAQTFGGKMSNMQDAVDALQNAIGSRLIGRLGDMAVAVGGAARNAAEFVDNLSGENIEDIKKNIGIMAGMASAYMVYTKGALLARTATIGFMKAAKFLVIFEAINFAVINVSENFEFFSKKIKEAQLAILEFFQNDTLTGLANAIQALPEAFTNTQPAIKGFQKMMEGIGLTGEDNAGKIAKLKEEIAAMGETTFAMNTESLEKYFELINGLGDLDLNSETLEEDIEKLQKQFEDLGNAATDSGNAIVESSEKSLETSLKNSALQGKLNKEQTIGHIRNKTMEASASHIANIFKSVPFPLDVILAAGAQATIAGIFNTVVSGGDSFATGGSFVTNKRTTLPIGNGIVVGDNASGMERIDVTPLPSPTSSGNNITINISAPLVDETVVDTIIPAIRRAEKLNL